MGEIADLYIDGDVCQECGQWLCDDGPGYPRTCTECGGDTPPLPIPDNDEEYGGSPDE